jgi:hypothetical protein
MKNDKIQFAVLLAACVGCTWLFAPPLRLWEMFFVGTASAVGVAAVLGTVLIRAGVVEPTRFRGDGSTATAVQGVGLAVLVYGSVWMSSPYLTAGIVIFGIGAILDVGRVGRQRQRRA